MALRRVLWGSSLAALVGGGCFSPEDGDADLTVALSESGSESTGLDPESDGADDPTDGEDDDGITSATNTSPTMTSPTSADATADASSDGGDACGEIVCVHGDCVNDTICDCEPGWEGIDCAVDIDDCADAPCVNGVCEDRENGFACVCDPAFEGRLCDALMMPFCLVGTVTVVDAFDVVNGNPSTMAFEHLEGTPIDFALVFDVPESYTLTNNDPYAGPIGQQRVLHAEALELTFSDPFMADVYGAAFAGMAYGGIVLVNGTTDGISMGNLVSPEGAEFWGWETAGTSALPVVVGDDGFPALLPSEGGGSGSLYLRRYQMADPLMTDFADSTWEMSLRNGPDCEP